ncbi:GNAT family N-acetyltransferase [Sphingomonadaceae bacterium]|nr:GNAT family N-acetyltransferase [Sphingomonadaceae bacterium]
MQYLLRPFEEGDAETLHSLTLAAIKAIGLAGYSREQVDAWAARHGDAASLQARVASGDRIFVAADEKNLPVAFSLIEPDGHLDQLYCHPEHSRQGLADRTLAAAERHARANGIKRLYTEASELARPAFERAGYTVTHRREFDIAHDGRDVAIHNYAMEKTLG